MAFTNPDTPSRAWKDLYLPESVKGLEDRVDAMRREMVASGASNHLLGFDNIVFKGQPLLAEGCAPTAPKKAPSMFQYAVIHTDSTGKKSIVVDVTSVAARSEQEARIVASRAIPTNFEDKMDEVTIIVRPFA